MGGDISSDSNFEEENQKGKKENGAGNIGITLPVAMADETKQDGKGIEQVILLSSYESDQSIARVQRVRFKVARRGPSGLGPLIISSEQDNQKKAWFQASPNRAKRENIDSNIFFLVEKRRGPLWGWDGECFSKGFMVKGRSLLLYL